MYVAAQDMPIVLVWEGTGRYGESINVRLEACTCRSLRTGGGGVLCRWVKKPSHTNIVVLCLVPLVLQPYLV